MGARRIFAFLSILAATGLLSISMWYYLSHHLGLRPFLDTHKSSEINAERARPLIQQAIQRYTNSPTLYVVPGKINIESANEADHDSFSYYGMTFSVPWKTAPIIQTSSPNGLLTFIDFPSDGKLVEAFASSVSISSFAKGVRSSYL